MTYSIRQATIEDLHQIAALFDAYRQFYEQAPDLDLATSFIQKRLANHESVILVAEENSGEAIGICQLYPSFGSIVAAPILVLYDLFVAPEHRNKGVGKALMLAAQAYAEERKVVRMDLSTAKDNLPAQKLYESLGWERDEEFYYYSLDIKSS